MVVTANSMAQELPTCLPSSSVFPLQRSKLYPSCHFRPEVRLRGWGGAVGVTGRTGPSLMGSLRQMEGPPSRASCSPPPGSVP